jgi:hypothetical protein
MVLKGLTAKQWQPLLHWLDTSGLALYFLDRIADLELCAMLPPSVLSRLQHNLADNAVRTQSLAKEWTTLNLLFQKAGLSYATLKGFSLWPVSVPMLELRSQLDLDFLVAEESAEGVQAILEGEGYRLSAISDRSWEFKTACGQSPSLKALYTAKPQRSVELHIERQSAAAPPLLSRTENRCFHGALMPVLSPVDLFLGQAMHVYKHLSSAFTRAAHLIEFRRHVLVRHHDGAFWREARRIAERDAKLPIALGVVVLLITDIMGEFAPEALTCWTVDSLPITVRTWVQLYGRRVALGSFPGSKLYLLLQKEVEALGIPAKRPTSRALLPSRLPPAIAHRVPGEAAATRVNRNAQQLHFIFFRLRFHTVEGLRYMYESFRWRWRLGRLTRQPGLPSIRSTFAKLRTEEVRIESNRVPR